MNLLKKVSLVLALTALTVAMALAQQSVTLTGTDGAGSGTVTFGIDPAATGGLDPALGEYGLPPLPPTFDLRCISMPRWDTLGSDGVRNNYHHQYRTTQTDTFRFAFQAEVGGSSVTISWPAGMGSLHGGFWRLISSDYVELCDMTEQTSYVFTTTDDVPQGTFMVAKGDGKAFHTATWMDMAGSVDYKGKGGKGESHKPYMSEGLFTFTCDLSGMDSMFVEFSQAVQLVSVTPFDTWTNPDGKKKKWYFGFTTNDTVPVGPSVEIFAIGDKGKALVGKSYYFWPQIIPLKYKVTKKGPAVATQARLRLRMPSWTNVGEELFLKDMAFPEPNGLLLGKTASWGLVKGKPAYRYVIMPKKYSAVFAALNKKGITHAGGTPDCFATYATKPVLKLLKGYFPDKQKNELVAALIALKFNIASSAYGHTSAGFGQLLYSAQAGDPPVVDGQTVEQIAALADGYLTDCSLTPAVTGAEFVTILNRISAQFSAPFDTASFGMKTVLAPARTLAEVGGVLYRTSLANVEPIITPNYSFETTPVEFKLNQNYPNPFNPTTTISFDLSADAFVSLKVYNTLGQEVATLINNEEFTEGSNDVEFDASALSSGVYYYRLVVNDGEMHQVQKMMLLK